MTERIINLPPPKHVDYLGDELVAFVETVDGLREEQVELHLAGFGFMAEVTDGQIRDLRFCYDYAAPSGEYLTTDQLLPTLSPLIDPVIKHESEEISDGDSFKLVVDSLRRAIWPNIIIGSDWHSGDPDRYLLSNIGTEVLVGDLVVPPDYQPSYNFENSYFPDDIGRGRGIAGDVVRFIIEKSEELPCGLDVIQPKPGELVRIDRNHVHRKPINQTE